MIEARDLEQFENVLFDHENLMSEKLKLKRVQSQFPDYWGAIKSLGAWGGDFAIVTSSRSFEETKKYFKSFGYNTLLTFNELINETGVNPIIPSNDGIMHESHVRQ